MARTFEKKVSGTAQVIRRKDLPNGRIELIVLGIGQGSTTLHISDLKKVGEGRHTATVCAGVAHGQLVEIICNERMIVNFDYDPARKLANLQVVN